MYVCKPHHIAVSWALLITLVVAIPPSLAQTCPTDDVTLLADCGVIERGQMCNTDGTAEAPPTVDEVNAPAVLHIQGTQPAALPSQNLVVLLMGGATVRNAVTQVERFTPSPPVSVQTTVTARLRADPTTDSDIVGGVEVGATLQADALSSDGEWVRIAWQNSTAWVSRSLLAADVANLPVFTGGYGDYQAMHITLADTCDHVVLQAPRVTEFPVWVNGERLIINNTVVLDLAPDGWLRVSALDGGVRRADDVRVPRGFSAMVQLTEDGNSADTWRPPRPMSQTQLDSYTPLVDLPVGVVNEVVALPQGAYIRPGQGQ